jgi:four helix bundle protein
MGVYRFEDLRVWQEAKALSDAIGRLIQRQALKQDEPLAAQLNAASLSTMANIAEGFLRRRDKEFAQFLRIAAASNGEVRALLHAASGRHHITATELEDLAGRSNSVGKMIRGLMRTLKA